MRRRSRQPLAGPFVAAVLGAAFFVWLFSARLIVPTEYEWVFKLDWRVHFLGWHMFRQDAWHMPPGRLENFGAPIGTAIGFTDSIPLVALPLKLIAAVLPMPFQYLGGWLLLCYALQAFFGALLARSWTTNIAAQVLTGCGFVLVPTLLRREFHPALCAHWLLLWALWLYFRVDRDEDVSRAHVGSLALIAGLVHPYLAVMTATLLGAVALRTMVDGAAEPRVRVMHALTMLALTAAGLLLGWWTSGLFTVSGDNLAAGGFGSSAMNVLGMFTPSGWSSLLPDWWTPTSEGWYEGFQYLGVGLLALLACALALRAARRQPQIAGRMWPLAVVCVALALYAVSPRLVAGATVLTDIDWLAVRSPFRANGRFFWPVAYVLLTVSVATVLTRMPQKAAVAVLTCVLALQLIDLRGELATRRQAFHDPAFYRWTPPLTAPLWNAALPHYDHVIVYQPPQCGPPPTLFEQVVYLAGLHGLTINGVLTARIDDARWRAVCADLDRSLLAGEVDTRTVYLLPPMYLDALRSRARQPMSCGIVDSVGVCVTTESYQTWRSTDRSLQ